MFTFGIFLCVVSVVSARPDVSLGYRYPSPGGLGVSSIGGGFGGGSGLGGGIGLGGGLGSIGSFGSYGGGGGISSYQGSSFGAGGGSVVSSASGYQQQQPQGVIISKHFHIYSGPEGEAGATQSKQIVVGQPQKHYRVVFIKAPAAGAGSARVSVSTAPQEEKTVIYVLAQKQDELHLDSDVATPAPTAPSKPEVYFIKYKTNEEAAIAQQQIQSQYDSLGGTSQVTDEGAAPVSSVIGSAGSGSIGASSVGVGHGVGGGLLGSASSSGLGSLALGTGASSAYLPPSH